MEACWAGREPTFTLTLSLTPSVPSGFSFFALLISLLLLKLFLLLPFSSTFLSVSLLMPFYLSLSHSLHSLSFIHLFFPVVLILLPFPRPVHFTSLPFAFSFLLFCFLPLFYLILYSLSSFLSLFLLLAFLKKKRSKLSSHHILNQFHTGADITQMKVCLHNVS